MNFKLCKLKICQSVFAYKCKNFLTISRFLHFRFTCFSENAEIATKITEKHPCTAFCTGVCNFSDLVENYFFALGTSFSLPPM